MAFESVLGEASKGQCQLDVSDNCLQRYCMCKCPEAGMCLLPSPMKPEWQQSEQGAGGADEVSEREGSQSMIPMAMQGQ